MLHDAVNNLRYEGKVQLTKNLKILERVTKFLTDDLIPHIHLDEKVIFPYLEKHVPKLNPMLGFLRGEHCEFKESFKAFEKLFSQFKNKKTDSHRRVLIEKLRDKGTYLFCLLRNHIQAENESVYRVMDEQLHKDEKQELLKLYATAERATEPARQVHLGCFA